LSLVYWLEEVNYGIPAFNRRFSRLSGRKDMAFARYESEKFTCIDVGVWLLKLNGFLMGSRDKLLILLFCSY
jgi:hypothetical protein